MNRLVDELHNPYKSRHIVSSNNVGESKIIENVSVLSEINIVVKDTSTDSSPSKIASVIENTSIDSCLSPSSLDEVHISPEDNSDHSDGVVAFMDSTPITDKIYVHENNQDGQENEVEFMVITPSVSSSSESLKFLALLHQVSFIVSSFSECLEFSHFLQISVCPSKVITSSVCLNCVLGNPCLSFPYI